MGKKTKLLGFIEDTIKDLDINTFFDAFSGSGVVSSYFKNKYNIISNDKQYYSELINNVNLINKYDKRILLKYIRELNNLKYIKNDNFYSDNYSCSYNNGISIGTDNNPKIWIDYNAKKIDIIRTKIDTYKDKTIRDYLIYCLIIASEKVSNTIGHQNGYLKKWCKRSLNKLELKYIEISKTNKNHKVFKEDIFDLLKNIKCDLVYYDPPYGTNNKKLSVATRYSSFYHLWNTMVKNDRPELFGKARKPIETKGWTPDLEKNKKEIIIPLYKKLIDKSNSKYVLFSYSNQGLLNKEDFKNLSDCYNISFFEKEYKINNQTKLAKKDGKYIDREKEKKLKELLILIKK